MLVIAGGVQGKIVARSADIEKRGVYKTWDPSMLVQLRKGKATQELPTYSYPEEGGINPKANA